VAALADGPHPFAAMVALSSGTLIREVATEHLAELLVTVFREAEKLTPPKPRRPRADR
jgi:hypothetical protein